LKIVIYARVSTKKQDLDNMLRSLNVWKEKNDHELVKIYSDFAVSGRKDDRKAIQELLKDARNGLFELVAVTELSRIGRSIGFIHRTIEELHSLGIKIVLTNSNTILDYGSLEGRALIGGLSLASDIEWMLIKERNERGRASIKARGIKVGRKHKVVSIEAIKALQDKGLSLRQIAKELGVSAPTIMRRVQNQTIIRN
jgi:site-specific DNA recombinase